MAKRRRPSRSQRNQAKWDNHAKKQARADVVPGLAGYAGGTKPVLNSGSIQASPRKVTVGGGNKKEGIESPTRQGGIKLQPFTDVIPSVPRDYATVKADHLTQDKQVWARVNLETGKICQATEEKCAQNHGVKCGKGRVWEGTIPDRKMMDFERARLAVRPAHEVAMMAADRPSGALEAKTHAERHADDKKAGLYRDGQGRIMRTVDMDGWNGEYGDFDVDLTGHGSRPYVWGGNNKSAYIQGDWEDFSLDCEIDPETSRVIIVEVNSKTGERRRRGHRVIRPVDSIARTTDYAHMHSVPIQRNTTQKRHAAEKEKAAKAEARAAKKAAREQERAERAASRMERMTSRPGRQTRAEADAAARAHLASLGVPESGMSRALIKAAREVLEHKAQVQAYVDGNQKVSA